MLFRSGGHVICRVLHRGKGINLLSQRKYDNTARVLAGSPLYTHTALNQPVDLAVSLLLAPLLIVFLNVSVSGLVCQGAYRSRTEGLSFTEDNFRIVMGLTLVLTGEV